MATQENYQPQVGNTTNGPNVHTYIPRSDGAIIVGGVAYFPQVPNSTTTAAVAVPAAPVDIPVSVPVAASAPAVAQPYIIPPGGPAVPIGQTFPNPPTMYYPQPQPQMSPYMIQQQPPIQGLPTFHIQQPAFNTYGLTGADLIQQQLSTAQGLEMNNPQEMKPSDDNPMRMYWVRELDGSYTQRNRLTIDSGDIGDVRWYVHDGGVFYAVRLPGG